MKSITIILATLMCAAVPVAAAAQTADGDNNGGGGHSKSGFVATYDTNNDGKVSKEEFTAKRSKDHKGFDLNENGTVNEQEYVTEYTFRLDKELAEHRGRAIRQAHFRFAVLDTNKDGILSAEEFAASGDRMFSRLDTTEDGKVDAADTAKSF